MSKNDDWKRPPWYQEQRTGQIFTSPSDPFLTASGSTPSESGVVFSQATLPVEIHQQGERFPSMGHLTQRQIEQSTLLLPKRSEKRAWNIAEWPRQHRCVFALIDGSRTSTQIAQLLTLSPELVHRILVDLRKNRFIELWNV